VTGCITSSYPTGHKPQCSGAVDPTTRALPLRCPKCSAAVDVVDLPSLRVRGVCAACSLPRFVDNRTTNAQTACLSTIAADGFVSDEWVDL
jgi:DNA-directed RNA polymerase subunit RPC12/RpoP